MSEEIRDAHLDRLRHTFDAYLARLRRGGLEPAFEYLSYDFARYENRTWHLLGDSMVLDELRELTNLLNRWHNLLQRWHAWNEVLASYAEQEAWALRREFIESDAHQCLIYPSAIRDALGFVVTNGIHQLRLATDATYEDRLDQDPRTPDKNPRRLKRHERERQLARLLAPWITDGPFMSLLQRIDDAEYREKTLDYRNEHSHAIGPSLEIGYTQFVRRIVGQKTRMEQQPDGTYRDVAIPGQLGVSYAFGGRPPLDMEASRGSSLEQFMRARACYQAYLDILDLGTIRMPERRGQTPQ